jgi:hypothetical protein
VFGDSLGAGKPKISVRNVTDALLSRAYTMVWLKLMDMPTSLALAPPPTLRKVKRVRSIITTAGAVFISKIPTAISWRS